MTKAERKAVAETLREWARWCEANPGEVWDAYIEWPDCESDPYILAWEAAYPWCEDRGKLFDEARLYTGPTAATGLLLAAAMVESGDSI